MQRFVVAIVAFLIGIASCTKTEIDPSFLAKETTLEESLRPIYLSSKVVNNQLEVSISPQAPFVCCCAPCLQPTYKSTVSYNVLIASSDAGPYRLYTVINVGSDEKQQLAGQSVTLPAELVDQPLVVRVIAVAGNGKAGYVAAIMASTVPAATVVSEVVITEQGENSGLSFSQDKSQALYGTYVQDPVSLAISYRLYLADYAQGQLTNKRLLTPSSFGGLFSRNGRQLAYFLPTETNNQSPRLIIHDIAANTNRLIELTANLWIASFSWSPDGQWIAFLEQNSTYSRLWKLNLADGKQQALTAAVPFTETGALWQGTIDWAPDGKSIAVTRKVSATATDFRVGITLVSPTDGAIITDLNTLPGSIDKNPAYSPDGQQIAFISSRTGSQGASYSIWIRNVASNQLRQVRLPDSFQLTDNFVPQWVGNDGLLFSAYTGSPRKQRRFIVSL